MFKNLRDLRLNCFSPPVMVATFVIELSLAVYTVWRYKMTAATRLIAVTLLCLATFQIVEFNVCELAWIDPMFASRLGHIAITLLPPLGLHLIYVLANLRGRRLVWVAYATAAMFIGAFALVQGSVTGAVCRPNYATFRIDYMLSQFYTLFYYGWLIIGFGIAFKQFNTKHWKKMVGMLIGYLAFFVPTAIVNFSWPSSLDGIPSIMCGFAVFFALILGLWVLPRSGAKERGK